MDPGELKPTPAGTSIYRLPPVRISQAPAPPDPEKTAMCQLSRRPPSSSLNCQVPPPNPRQAGEGKGFLKGTPSSPSLIGVGRRRK